MYGPLLQTATSFHPHMPVVYMLKGFYLVYLVYHVLQYVNETLDYILLVLSGKTCKIYSSDFQISELSESKDKVC